MNAGADIGYAEMNTDAAVRFDRNRRAGLPGARRPLVDSDAAAGIFRLGLFPAGGVECFLEDILDDDAFEFLSERRRFAVVEQILHAEFDRVDAQLAGDNIDVRLDGEGRLGAARRARLRARNLVGIGAQGFDLDRRNAVIARRASWSLYGDLGVGFERGVAAAAEDRTHLHGGELAFTIDAGTQCDHRRVAMRHRGQLFAVFQHHAHRFPGLPGKKVADRRFGDGCLAAEIAAHRQNMHLDLLLFETEIAGEAAAQGERCLVRCPDFDAAVVIDIYGAGMGLDVAVEAERRAEGMFENS